MMQRCISTRQPASLVIPFFFNDPPTPEIYTLSLHDALPICRRRHDHCDRARPGHLPRGRARSEEHTSELQSPYDLVCRLLLEKKKKKARVTTWLSRRTRSTYS